MFAGVLVSAALSAWILVGGITSIPPQATGLCLAAIILDVAAPKLRRFGFFSLGSGPLLALGMLAPGACRVALIVGLISLTIRVLMRGSVTLKLRFLESLVDFLPLVLSLTVAAKVPLRAGFFAYLPALVLGFSWITASSILVSEVPHDVQEEWSAYRSQLICGGIGVAATAIILSNSPTPGTEFGTFILLGLLTLMAPLVVASVDANRLGIAQREKQRELSEHKVGLQATEDVLRKTGEEQQRSAAELAVRLGAYRLVEDMLEGISLRPILKDVAQTVIDRLRRKVRCQTTVLFWKLDGNLVPLAQRTTQAERLQASSLLGFQEAVVIRAHKLGRSERGIPEDETGVERIFPDELSTLAVPMRDRGVLYFGNPSSLDLDEEANHFLQVLANHAVIALGAAEYYELLAESLQREGSAASKNVALVQKLAKVIDSVTEIVDLRDPEQMLERTGQLLEQLIPHDLRLLWRMKDAKTETTALSKSFPPEGNSIMMDYALVVCNTGRPLLLEKFQEGRFPAPQVGATSLLALPMTSERGIIGAVVLTRISQEVFEREDQDILSVMVYQLSAALLSAQLYSQLQDAHVALKESQAQVVQSSKMAAIGQLAGGVAHELNTPLGAIALAVDGALAALHTKPDRAESRLNRACVSVQQMKEIVSKLLFYSRDARSGRRETELNKVIEDTLQLIGHQIRLDNVQIDTQFAELPMLIANQNELQQVFTNLCLNARDAVAMPGANERRILIVTSMEGEWLKATVRDWGCGMPAEVRERIFDPFYTTKEVGKGTGLGLSVTLELVEQHGGKISVESHTGHGTQFTLLLPITPPPEE